MPNWSSWPSGVSRYFGGVITPALLTSRSSEPSYRSTNSWIEVCEARSSCSTVLTPLIFLATSRAASVLRQASTTSAPWSASAAAVWKPMPELAPVTTALVPVRSGRSLGLNPGRAGVSDIVLLGSGGVEVLNHRSHAMVTRQSRRGSVCIRPEPSLPSERLITIRWIWLVPSKIWVTLASRMNRSTGKSRV